MILLTEKPYKAIQGEGIDMGQACIFIRLFGCNLQCSWCDSKFTWHNDFIKKNNIIKISPEELFEEIKESKYIIITGGEPTLQQEKLKPFLKLCKNEGIKIGIESNGSIQVSKEFQCMIDTYIISPKLKNSENPNHLFFPVKKAKYKFILKSEKDIKEMQIFSEKHCIEKENIFLSPEGTTKEKILEKKWLFEFCMKECYNYSCRLHVLFFNSKNGV